MKKDWIARELTLEVVVGVFMITVFFGIAYFTIVLSRDAWFSRKHHVEVRFNHVMGLREGDSVVVRGMPIGKVQQLKLQEDGVMVVASLDERVRLREGYRISVVTSSILGGRYLDVDEGPLENPLLAEGTIPRGRDPYDLMADAAELVAAIKDGVIEGGVVENIQSVSADLREITARINAGEGFVGKLLSSDDSVFTDLAALVASLRGIVEKVEEGHGMIGKMLSDDSLYEEIEKMVVEIRATIDDVRESSPVVTFTSIFFGAF